MSTRRLGIRCSAALCTCVLACVECPATAPRLGESCETCGVRVCPCGGSLQVEARSWSLRLKIVAGKSDHPSRCRWTAGKRASSRDARDSDADGGVLSTSVHDDKAAVPREIGDQTARFTRRAATRAATNGSSGLRWRSGQWTRRGPLLMSAALLRSSSP